MKTSLVSADFGTRLGKVKPLHAVNNGPVYKFTEDQRITNIDAFREAKIPYGRTHDTSLYSTYGGHHAVDVMGIFPDFSKDVNDPASYDFAITDEFLHVMTFAGVEPFYRLGHHIEHWCKKYGTLPPPDFRKWAEICEHIIRHYTEGWADGFFYRIEYWEIWNEPDGRRDDDPPVKKKCWGGTKAQFFDFYEIVAKHLKGCFPHLKIGGPAIVRPTVDHVWPVEFLHEMKKRDVPIDFFSWHRYCKTPDDIFFHTDYVRKLLDESGYEETESILDEWNYVKGWKGDDWLYSLRNEKGLKGASFVAGCMLGEQYKPLDMLMYYDARPCAMNGMFNTDFVCDRLKGYYPFWMFARLYELESAVPFESDDATIYGAAAVGEGKAALMFTFYEDLDEAERKEVKIDLPRLPFDAKKLSVYLLDETHDAERIREEEASGRNAGLSLEVGLFSTVLVIAEG